MNIAAEKKMPAAAVSGLQLQLQSGKFVATAELLPPVSTDPAEFIERAIALRGLATAVNVTDGAGARAHMSSLAVAHFLVQNRIEPILQMTCRDRNRIALQNDLLGAVALGVRNILALKGDDPKSGDQPDTKPVFDLDTTALLAMAARMRSEKKLPSGTEIKGEVNLVLGAADMPIDPPTDWQPKGLMAKIEAGADFAQTQFCMDVGVARRYAARLLDLGVAQKLPILIGIAPLASARSARWMKEKLFGTIIPDEIVARMERAADAKSEGKKICVELMQQLAEVPGIGGVHIMAPNNHAAIAEVLAASGVVGKQRTGFHS